MEVTTEHMRKWLHPKPPEIIFTIFIVCLSEAKIKAGFMWISLHFTTSLLLDKPLGPLKHHMSMEACRGQNYCLVLMRHEANINIYLRLLFILFSPVIS